MADQPSHENSAYLAMIETARLAKEATEASDRTFWLKAAVGVGMLIIAAVGVWLQS